MMSEPAPDGGLVLGLGNPGERYRGSRHNLGFLVIDELARRHEAQVGRLECGALVGALQGPRGAVLLAKPQTYMNRSGHAARCLTERHQVPPERILVVYDDLALPLGRLRIRPKGSPGGHRGMESVLDHLRTDRVPRLRLGIAPDRSPLAGDRQVDFVLEAFGEDERAPVEEMVRRAADACEAWLEEGVEAAMNRFNGEPTETAGEDDEDRGPTTT